ncbi:MAG: SPOR domain-containing protein [Flavobacteriales bacterium]|nr:SPOR domain-containing protein [Flavobacteriales bacterium]
MKEYRVNIGEYADDIPNDVAGVYLQLTGRGIKSYEKGDKTVYLIGSFDNFEDAEKLKKEMQEMGIKGAKVVTYVNDKETDSK